MEDHDPDALKELFGKAAVISGTAHYWPSRRLLMVVAEAIDEAGARNMRKNNLWIAACAKAAGARLLRTDKDCGYLANSMLTVEFIDPASMKTPACRESHVGLRMRDARPQGEPNIKRELMYWIIQKPT